MTDDLDAGGGSPAGMPEGLPSQFWNAETGQVDMPGLVKSYGELATFKAQEDERLKAAPTKADDYKIEAKLPEGTMVPVGYVPNVDPADPRIPALKEFAAKQRLSQEDVNAIVGIDLQAKVQEQLAFDAELQAEFKKLGENGKERVRAVEQALAAHVGEEAYEAMRPFINSATALSALEKLIAKAGAPPPKPNGASVPGRAADRLYGQKG